MAKTVPVYRFKRYNLLNDKYDVSRCKATKETIARFGCEIVEGSAELVDESTLDGLGRYK